MRELEIGIVLIELSKNFS